MRLFIITFSFALQIAFACDDSKAEKLAKVFLREPASNTKCNAALDQYFDFTSSIIESSVRYTLDSCDLYNMVKNFSNLEKNLDLVNGIAFSKDIFSSYGVSSKESDQPDLSCNVQNGYNISKNDFCEPSPPHCLIGGIYYAQLHKKKMSTPQVEAKTRSLLYALVASSKNGNGEKFYNLIRSDCLNSSDSSSLDIYELFTSESKESTFNHFYKLINSNNKQSYKNELNNIKKINVTCAVAFEKINTQYKQWHEMLIFADYNYSFDSNIKKYDPQTYEIVEGNTIAYKTFPQIMKYAAHQLSDDGYIQKNIELFKRHCINNESIPLNTIIHPNSLNSFIKNNESNKAQMRKQMNSIKKEYLYVPPIPGENKNSDSASVN